MNYILGDDGYMRCACGARSEAVDSSRFGDAEPSYLPGRPIDRCTCPHCPTCGRKLVQESDAPHPTCPTLFCPLSDVWHVVTFA